MTRFFAHVLLICLAFSIVSCDEGSGRQRKRRQRDESVVLPAKSAKIAFIFPAGAGAMRASLAVTEKLEADLEIPVLGNAIHAAGGVSSGSLLAAALTSGKADLTSKGLKGEMGNLVRAVFPDTNKLVDQLIKDYKFSLDELESMFVEIMKSPPDLSSLPAAQKDLEKILTSASAEKISIRRKIAAKGDMSAFITAIVPSVAGMLNQDSAHATELTNTIKKIIGDVPLSDPMANKFIAFASNNKKPVFFGPQRFAQFVNGPFAVSATKLHEALVSSSAIPHFIKAPITISFTVPEGGTKVLPDLIDGVFANEGKFDPSAIFYEMYSKLFPDEELLIVYVGNGAPTDKAFRSNLRTKYGFKNLISQQVLPNGNKITYVAIDTKIVDNDGNSLFNLSGFYDSPDLAKYMNEAGKKATTSKAYLWVLEAMKAATK